MVRHAITFLTGLAFGLGGIVSGMANPMVVMNFFDVAGAWDPSLIFVMAAAVAITFVGYRIIFRRHAPLWAPRFAVPGHARIDARLILGAAIFGIGWGMSGFCPGGLLPVVGTGHPDVLIFLAAMLAGMFGTRAVLRAAEARRTRNLAGAGA